MYFHRLSTLYTPYFLLRMYKTKKNDYINLMSEYLSFTSIITVLSVSFQPYPKFQRP